MVEQTPNGWLPVVMDFGLAREAGEGKGLTESGAVLGTPAYMSPEQARGDVRHLDHRTDVYSLGATLYDLLAGVPPFDAESVVDLLMAVLDNEPIPLRTRIPSLPVALETIVGRCLVKEREQRYPSAIALADDLDRFLLGEEIRARRIGLYLRGSRWVRKHKALSAVSLLSVIAVLFLIGAGVLQRIAARRDAQQAMRRAALERQLAQQLKEITWILRVAYQLPAHDVRFEQAMVRARLQELTRRGAGLGRVGEGLVAYAEAEGHLALHEYKAAYEKLQQAQAAGIDTPELHHALGRTLGALFEQGLADARRSGDKSWQEKRRVELAAQYLQPALRSLEKSRSLELESPEYLDGLIAYYQQKYEEAQSKGRRAAALLPWLYEAEQLEGNALFERALALKNSGEYDDSRKLLQDSLRHYQAAAEIGRSDEQVYDALCTAWQLHAELDRTQGRPQEDAMQRSINACDLMITTAPYHSTGYTKKARAYFFLAWPMLMLNKDIRPFASLAILNAKIAIERNANDAYAYDMLGNSYVCLARYGLRLEVDPNDYVEKALVAFKQSVKINENFPWAYNDIGVAINTVGAWNHENGKSPVAQLRNAIASFQRAIAIDQMYQSAYTGALRSYRLIVIHKISVGIDPAADVAESDLLAEQLLKMNNNSKPFYRNRVAQRLEYAGYLLKIGSDPDPVLKSALNDIAALRNIDLHDTVIHTHEAYAYQLLSMHNVQNSITPIPFAEKGMAAAQKCLEVVPDFANCIATYGSLRMIVWLWDEKNGDRISGNLSRYLDSLLSLRNSIREDPDVGCVIAEVAYAVAERTVGKKRSDALEAGSRVLSAVLVRASHFSLAHVLRGRLWLLAAADYKNPSERRLRLANARSSFLRAFELDPLLRRQYGAQLAETERRLGIASAELKN